MDYIGGSQSADPSTVNSIQAADEQKKKRNYKEVFVAAWMTQYLWLDSVLIEDVQQKICGLP